MLLDAVVFGRRFAYIPGHSGDGQCRPHFTDKRTEPWVAVRVAKATELLGRRGSACDFLLPSGIRKPSGSEKWETERRTQ